MPRGTIGSLIARQGQIQGNLARELGAIRSEGAGRIGQAIMGGLGAYMGRREEEGAMAAQAEQDAQFAALVENAGDPRMTPDLFMSQAISIYGQEKGQIAAGAVMNYRKLVNDLTASAQALEAGDRKAAKEREAEAKQSLQFIVESVGAFGGPETVMGAQMVEAMVPVANEFARQQGLDVELTPEYATENWDQMATLYGPEEDAPIKLGAQERLVTPGGETVVGAAEKPDARGIEARLAEAAVSGDTETQQALLGAEQRLKAAGRAPERAPKPAPLSQSPQEWQNVADRASLKDPKLRDALKGTVQRLLDAGDEEQAKEVIRQAAIESELADDRRQIVGRRATADALRDIGSMLKELKSEGINTGLLRGFSEDAFRKLGRTTDPRLTELITRLRSTVVTYRRAMTGVAFNPQEAAQYEALFPSYKNQPPVNEAIIDGLIRSLETNDREFWTRKLGEKGAELVGAVGGTEKGGGGFDETESYGYPVGTVIVGPDGNELRWDGSRWTSAGPS